MNNPRPKAKLSRALGIPLTPKCVRYFEKRPFPPGVHGRGRRKASDYQVRLLEKQRLRHQYNISEAQMRMAYDDAHRAEGKTGEAMVTLILRVWGRCTDLQVPDAPVIEEAGAVGFPVGVPTTEATGPGMSSQA